MVIQLPDSIANTIKHFAGRSWLLPPLVEWFDQSTQRLFVLTGAPGTGKSMIAAWLSGISPPLGDTKVSEPLTYLRSQVRATHFCIADSGTTDPRNFATNIVKQLTQTIKGFSDALLKTIPEQIQVVVKQEVNVANNSNITGVHIESLNMGALGGEASFNRLVREPLKQLYSDGYNQPILILIDSLDEAATYSDEIKIVDLLTKLIDFPAQVRFLVTTRPDPRILKYFPDGKYFDLIDDTPDTTNDIQQYAYERLNILEENQRSRLSIAISQASEGIFLYAYLVIEDLLLHPSNLIAIESISFPKKLSGLYHQFLNRELGKDEKRWYDFFKPLLGAIAVSQGDRLNHQQLAVIVGKDLDDIELSLRSCAQYLHHLPNGSFQIFHKSFSDFLLDDKDNTDYHIAPATAHQRIADYYWNRFSSDWSQSDRYGLQYLPIHIVEAIKHNKYPESVQYNNKLRELLLTFSWLQAKLNATSIYSLITDYNFLSNEPVLQTLQEALQLSAHVLAQNPSQLTNQIRGRLASSEANDLQELLRQSIPTGTPWLRFLKSSFTTPGERLIRTLIGHTSNVRAIAITANDTQIISASGDNTVKIWDLETGQELYTLRGHTKPIKSVAVSPDSTQVISASADQTLRVWDLRTRQTRFVLKGHTQEVKAVAITPDSHYALSASEDHTLKLWDLETGQERMTLWGHSDRVEAIAITPDGEKAISGSGDNTLKIWDLKTGHELFTMSGHAAAIRSVAITPNGKQAVSASADRTLIIWNLATGERSLAPLIGHQGQVQAIAIMPDGKQIISASFDRTIKIWDLQTGKELSTWMAHADKVLAVAITSTGKEIISASFDETIKIWHLDSTKQKESFTFGHTSKIEHVSITPNGGEIIACSSKGAIKVWDVQTWSERTINNLSRKVESAVVTKDGENAVLGLSDGTFQVWELRVGQQILNLNEHRQKHCRDRLSLVAASPDSRIIAAVSSKNIIKIWKHEKQTADFGSHKEHFSFLSGQELVTALTIAFNCKQIFAGLSNGKIRSWSLENRKRLDNLQVHQSAITALSLSSDDSFLIAGSSKGTLKILGMQSGKECFVLDGHTEAICSVAITSNNVRAASASRDGTLKIWSLTDGKLIESFVGESPLTHCTFSSDNSTLIVGEVSGRLHYLKLEGVD